MAPSLPRHPLISRLVIVFLLAAPACAETVARFWLENTITQQTYGPILNQSGFRFQIDTDGYVVLPAPAGQVLFSTFPQIQHMGPFDLELNRILALGARAFTVVRMDEVTAPPIPSEVLPGIAPPPVVPAPIYPSSRPVQPIEPQPWMWNTSPSPVETALWFEPFHHVKYDWKLGAQEGKRESKLELTRMAVALSWAGWQAAMGYTFKAQHSASVLEPSEEIIDLRLKEGDGFFASLSYGHRIRLDDRWHATAGGGIEYRGEKYDLIATVYDGTETVTLDADPDADDEPDPGQDETEIPIYRDIAKRTSLDDLSVSLRGKIVYEGNAWGTALELILHVWDDVKTDGTIQVLDRPNYSLSGARSHPITVASSAWCYLLEGVKAEARISFGGEMGVRLGVGYEW